MSAVRLLFVASSKVLEINYLKLDMSARSIDIVDSTAQLCGHVMLL